VHKCEKSVFFFGFSYWKHTFIEPFFDQKLIFINPLFGKNHLKKAICKGLNSSSTVYIWGKKSFPHVEEYALKNHIPICRVEDGFIRSVGLGSDLTQPYSLVVDKRGIYFDPTCESDLEVILQHHVFTEDEIMRAQKIRHYMVEKKLSKYNLYDNVDLDFPKEKLIVVVPGQVDDDASIRFGALGMSNLELLKQVRHNRPDSYIVFKPHPDVLAGNRVGHVDEAEALKYCDRIVTEVGIDSVLAHADEVHTMTSLVGFEALMRGIHVVTYGVPFYAGWGLSEDKTRCERRSRSLSIDDLVAATYLLYPKYIHPKSLLCCEIEEVLAFIEHNRQSFQESRWIHVRNWISRKTQMIIRMTNGL
jgi:capsular polysaccharide export protein